MLPEPIAEPVHLDELTPREIVRELDKYVIGQAAAKRAVAVALRNRIRRQKLPPEMADEVMPKNIIMIGPTGVGKTELARDLVEIAIDMVRNERLSEVEEKAEANAEERILDLLLPPQTSRDPNDETARSASEHTARTREKLRTQLRGSKLDERIVEIEIKERSFPTFEIISNQGVEEMDINLKDILPGFLGQRTTKRKMKVVEAMEYLIQEEEQKLVDMDQVTRVAVERVEDNGIIFLDEIDKIAGRESGHGPDVSREGVQRDILPIVEGTTVNTRYGMVRTDHVLFIAAGAFHVSKPSDLIPELQGRFPIRVELESLTIEDFKRILTEPRNALIKQYQAMMETEGVAIEFTSDAIDSIANFAAQVNQQTENIGARRLQTIMEKLLEDISFEGPDLEQKNQRIDARYVENMLSETVKDQDLSRYIL